MTDEEFTKIIEDVVKETTAKTWAAARAAFDDELRTYASAFDALAARPEAIANGDAQGLEAAADGLRQAANTPAKRTMQL